MNNKRAIILLILSIFVIGMVMGAASASHTFKKGKYKCTVSDKEYKKIKKGYEVTKKVGTKKVTKWTTKKMKTYESWVDKNGVLYKSKSWNPYAKWGYNIKYVKSVWKYYSDGDICWGYYKVPTKVTKNVYMHMCYSKFQKKIIVEVDTYKYI